MIQAQIKPHFLYNTLDLNLYFLPDEKTHKVLQKSQKPWQIITVPVYQVAGKIINIGEEVKNISSYLLIQKRTLQ